MDQPKNGQQYFYVTDFGKIEAAEWKDTETDKGRLKIGNVHMHRDMAMEHRKKLENFSTTSTPSQERQTVA